MANEVSNRVVDPKSQLRNADLQHDQPDKISDINTTQGTPPKRRSLLSYIALAGPAFVAGAWQFGPGNLTTAVQAGSGFSYSLIWVIAVSTLLMLFLVDMSVRLGIKTPVSLISSIKNSLGSIFGTLAGVGVFLICLCFSVGNAVGAGLGLNMLLGGNPIMWTVIVTRSWSNPVRETGLPSHREGAHRNRCSDGDCIRSQRFYGESRME